MVRMRKKLLLVDGYNVLRSGARYRTLKGTPDYTHDAFNAARERLISDVATFAGSEYAATIVFDAGDNVLSDGKPEIVAGVKIMFSPTGSTADKVLEKLAHNAKQRSVEAIVVSSDARIQETVFGGGVVRMSANDFSREVQSCTADMKAASHCPNPVPKSTVASRINPTVVEKLKALRDGGL